MTYSIIKTEVHDKVGLVLINRPTAMNALNATVMEELATALEEFDSDPDIGAMVLAGDERAFAAGADIKEMASASSVDMLKADRISRWDRIRKIKKPVIAAVSGWCLGGGHELAMGCDLIVASETAKVWAAGDQPGRHAWRRRDTVADPCSWQRPWRWRWCSTTAISRQRKRCVTDWSIAWHRLRSTWRMP